MNKLRKQSDSTYPMMFLMVDSTDHVTGKTGLSPTVTISKNGASFASPSGAVAEVGNGLYKVAGNATDSNTVGELWIHATATGADPTDTAYTVVPYDPFDSVRLGLTALPNVVAAGNGGLPTVDGSNQVKALVYGYNTGQTPLQPTVAGRTLDVTSTGAAGIDWANIENPTTTVGLSGTTVGATTAAGDSPRVLTALPNVAPGANGGLPTANSGNEVRAIVYSYNTGMTPLQPTVSGRTLDVTITGAAGIDWGNVENPTTANNLSGTNIATNQSVLITSGTGSGQLNVTSGVVKSDVSAYSSGMTPLQPTVAGRTLDVTATGAAGLDWGNIENPTTTVGLSGTTVGSTTAAGDSSGVTTLLTRVPSALTITGGSVNVNSLGATAKSEVNAEVLDVLTVDTFAEPGSVPSATATLKDKIGWMQSLSRNKVTQTSTTQVLRNDADGANISSSTVSDDGTTFIRGKYT